MSDLFSSISTQAFDILSKTGYAGVFILSFLDRFTIFLIPGEIVLPAFGVLVGRGDLSFWPVFLFVTVGAFLGNLVLYFIFLKGGRPFLERYGCYFLISKHELAHLDRWFSRYGDKLIFIGYLLPTSIRSLVPIPAGVSRMGLSRFSLYTLIGSLPYNFLLIYVGIKAGDRFEEMLSYLDRFNYVTFAIIAVFVVWYIIRHIKGKHLTHG